jgi:GT2 family glycosyltransferase
MVESRRVTLVLISGCDGPFVRDAVDRIRLHTRPTCELLIVDNGSTDGFAAYAAGVRPTDAIGEVKTLRNVPRRSFAASCNVAAEQSRGEIIVFLHNDAYVSAGWLEGLLRCLEHSLEVAMAGPVTNRGFPSQTLPQSPTEVAESDRFAERLQSERRWEGKFVHRLGSFCLAVKREVLAAIGGWDERFDAAFLDDEDLCLRVRNAGWKMMCASGIYVHHDVGRELAQRRIDVPAAFERSRGVLAKKWGSDLAARYALTPTPAHHAVPARNTVPANPPSRPRVTLCMIARDASADLAACLGSVRGLPDEIVVVDTGSADNTVETARSFGAKVVSFPWTDDFSAARNEGLRHAKGEWIFWLDCDDRIEADQVSVLRDCFATLRDDTAAYMMRVLSPTDAGGGSVIDQARLFRNRERIRWRYRVHEQILLSIEEQGGIVRRTEATILHNGYRCPRTRQIKLGRNMKLLRMDAAERPRDSFVLFNFGAALVEAKETEAAIDVLRRCIAVCPATASFYAKANVLLAHALVETARLEEASQVLDEARSVLPHHLELMHQQALVHSARDDHMQAIRLLESVLAGTPGAAYSGQELGQNSYVALHHLAIAWMKLGRAEQAERRWREATDRCADYLPAWTSLADLYLRQDRRDDFESLRSKLESVGFHRIVRELDAVRTKAESMRVGALAHASSDSRNGKSSR